MLRGVFFFLFVIILTGCGYHYFNEGSSQKTISIPYVEKDKEGFLTSFLCEKITASGVGRYVHYKGDLQLFVTIDSLEKEAVGYRRDRNDVGALKSNLIKDEGRWVIKVSVTLSKKDKVLWGPIEICENADYDYTNQNSPTELTFTDTNGVVQPTLNFSLGQFESISSADEAAKRNLYRKTAQKIVDVIIAKW